MAYMSPLQMVMLAGRVVSVEAKNTKNGQAFTSVMISSPISRKKKSDEKYQPSNLYQLAIWANDGYTSAVLPFLNKGVNVIITGDLGEVRSYERNGTTNHILNIEKVSKINVIRDNDSTNPAPIFDAQTATPDVQVQVRDLSELLEDNDAPNLDDDF